MNNLIELLNHQVGRGVPAEPSSNPEPRTANPEPFADTLDRLECLSEHAQTMAQDSPNIFLKAAINIATVDFFTVLNRFDTVTLSKRLEEKPELYFQMINSQLNLMKAGLEQQKLEFKQKQAEARQRDRDQKLRARKPILLTAQTLDRFGQVLARSRRREEADPTPPASPTPDIGLQTQDPSSSTSNTGPCEILEVPVPPNFAPPIATPDFEEPWSEEHSDALVCCPS